MPRMPGERRMRWARALRVLAVALVGLAVVSALDGVVYRRVAWPPEDRAIGELKDWYQMFRSLGYLPVWVVIGGVIVLLGRGEGSALAWRRACAVVVCALSAGLAAEVLKLLVGRERPEVAGMDGVWQGYVFRAPLGAFADSTNLGMPSSHAATAFGGAFGLAAVFPALRWLILLMAAGCGLTRLLAGAHFASDVYVGIVLGWVSGRWGWRAIGGRASWSPAVVPPWERVG